MPECRILALNRRGICLREWASHMDTKSVDLIGVWHDLYVMLGSSSAALIGLLLAIVLRRLDLPPRRRYSWEDEATPPSSH